ncbi:hypothetical protein UM48_000235 [Salmonella enterica subsp. enterica]|nr:hypothetical protein [Salmonella enterica subsp. enterica]EDR7035532.1 hypothetical protein [Salmonella enterica subsp. enterica serovar Concord]EEC0934967.1 hypothetical protein [Salmonella enterica subsp. enterica]
MIGCIFNYLHKTKPAVASSDKRNPRECEDCYCCGDAGSGGNIIHRYTSSSPNDVPSCRSSQSSITCPATYSPCFDTAEM